MKVQGRIPLAPGVDPGFDIIELPESKLQRRGVYPFVPVAARGVACDWLVAWVFVKYYEAGGQEYTRYGNGVSALRSWMSEERHLRAQLRAGEVFWVNTLNPEDDVDIDVSTPASWDLVRV